MSKKVLIIGQSFNTNTGGGITLSNLFSEWPKEKIALATFGQGVTNISFEKVQFIYQLGSDEISTRFPLSIFKKKFKSGKITKNSTAYKNSLVLSSENTSIRLFLINTILKLIKKSGLYNFAEKIDLSVKFEKWVLDFAPDFIYTQLGSLALTQFVTDVGKKLDIPVMVHIMDDWPSVIPGFLGFLYKKKLNNRINRFFNMCFLHLAISDNMADEYKKRYGNKWFVFHNSIDLSKWDHSSNVNKTEKSVFKILYIGRIGVANKKSIIKFGNIISNLSISSVNIELHLYILSNNEKLRKTLCSFNNVYCHDPVSYSDVPKLVKQFDLLLLPIDFDKAGIKFAKYSMPTKMTEYMVSGIPSLIFAPEVCAVTNYAIKNNVAFTCTDENEQVVVETIKRIIYNIEERENISKKAIIYAKKNHNIENERLRFKSLIYKCLTNFKHE